MPLVHPEAYAITSIVASPTQVVPLRSYSKEVMMDSKIDNFEWPLMTSFEADILLEWFNLEKQSLKTLLNILIKKYNATPRGSTIEKINKMSFTPVEGSIYNNRFCSFLLLYAVLKTTIEECDEKAISHIKNKLRAKFDDIVAFYLPDGILTVKL